MPIMSGYDLLKIVKNDEKYKDIPFLIVTSETLKNNIMEALEAGVDDYIVKPFNADTLREKLETILIQRVKT